MIATDKPNPFRVLMVPSDATLETIVSQSEELYQLAESREEEMLQRWAAEQLSTNARTRLAYELFELPEARYMDEEWESFIRQNKRGENSSPGVLQEMPAPGPDDLNLAALTELLLTDLLVEKEPDLDQAIDGSPLVPKYTFPLKEEQMLCG